jgi:hypothetical protein
MSFLCWQLSGPGVKLSSGTLKEFFSAKFSGRVAGAGKGTPVKKYFAVQIQA